MKEIRPSLLLMVVFIFTGSFFVEFTLTAGAAEEKGKCETEWVMTPPPAENDGMFAIGKAKDEPNPKETADNRAIDEVVRSVQLRITKMVKQFLKDNDIGENISSTPDSTPDKDIRRQCKIVKRERCPDGTWISHAIYPIENNFKAVKKTLKDSGKSPQNDAESFEAFKVRDESDFQKFKSEKKMEK